MTFSSLYLRARTRWNPLALVATLFALAGCANYAGIQSDKHTASISQFDTAQSLAGEGGQWPALDWAHRFGDPQLPALINEALEGNPSIAQAHARVAKAQSYLDSARSTLYPNVNASYSWNRGIYSETALFPPPFGGTWYSENNALASASWDLDLWGKNRARLEAAVSLEKAAQADMQQSRITLATSVARTYNQLAFLYQLKDNTAREIDNRKTVSAITNERIHAGLDNTIEKQTVLGDIASTQATLTHLDGQIATVRYQLAALLGKGPDRGLSIAPPLLVSSSEVALPNNLPADLIARRPDLVAARWQVQAALHDVKEAKAEFFPDINLAATFGFDTYSWRRFLTSASRQGQFGPALHLPIFDAGALRAQLKSRYAAFDLDVANYNQTLINALAEVATQIATIHSIDQETRDAQHALDASTEAYRLAVTRYQAGLAPQLVVLNADANRLSAERVLTQLTMQRRDMQFALIHALGGGFDEDRAGIGEPDHAPALTTLSALKPS